MLFSIALLLLFGLMLSGLLQKVKIPGLVGMLLTGIIMGPYALNLMDPELLRISPDLRKMALIVILFRAGLALDLKDLKRVGRPALLMCFVPATFEIIATTLLAPLLFPITYLEAALLGTVLGAVSPAIVVPRMLKLMENGYGRERSIPQLVLAGASVDDIYVIVLFTSFLGMYGGSRFDAGGLLRIPVSIVLGVVGGILLGIGLVKLFRWIHMRDTVKILILLAVSFVLVTLEDVLSAVVPFSGLLAVMALGGTILKQYDVLAKRLSGKFSKIWVAAELLLFVLVGATVDVRYATQAGLAALALVGMALVFRMAGVFLSVTGTSLNLKERLFCGLAYLPKATVQAAIGGIPLAAGGRGQSHPDGRGAVHSGHGAARRDWHRRDVSETVGTRGVKTRRKLHEAGCQGSRLFCVILFSMISQQPKTQKTLSGRGQKVANTSVKNLSKID